MILLLGDKVVVVTSVSVKYTNFADADALAAQLLQAPNFSLKLTAMPELIFRSFEMQWHRA